MTARRAHVFSLTEDERTAVGLYRAHRWMTVSRFARELGISKYWLFHALDKAREIAQFDTPPVPHPSSLSRARGRVRMDGTH